MVERTVQDYFGNMHKITLRFPDLPCLHVGPKAKNIYLPLEVSIITLFMFLYLKFFCVIVLQDCQRAKVHQEIDRTSTKTHD